MSIKIFLNQQMNQTDIIRKVKLVQIKIIEQESKMTQQEYGNKSISSLVEELNNLGNRSVLIKDTQLMVIQSGQNKYIRRYQTKSNPRKQFYKCNQSDKKYFYNHTNCKLDQNGLRQFMTNWQKGYNCTILLQNINQNIIKALTAVQSWIKRCLTFGIVLNKHNQLIDIFSQSNITHRQLLQNKKYYQINYSNKLNQITEYINSIIIANNDHFQQSTLIDITFKNPQSCSQLHLTFLPSQMFTSQCNPPFSLIKTQLTQILNYIKINPNKRYQHISKLITKRLPITNYLTKILMSDSCNLLINFIQPSNYQQINSIPKFQFFDKITTVSNLLRKPDRHIVEIAVKKPIKLSNSLNQISDHPSPLTMTRTKQQQSSKQNMTKGDIVSPIGRLNLKTQNEYDLQITQKQKDLEKKQFEFCRSLQRKTHKFSISPRQQNSNRQSKQKIHHKNLVSSQVETFLDKKTISKYDSHSYQGQFNNIQLSKKLGQQTISNVRQIPQHSQQNIYISQSEQITLLKAQHAREISQYHQTIQLLNKKIIVLTKQLNIQELYKIHERQIMLLQLKIKELREDIVTFTKDEPNQKAIKYIVKKLTEEVKSYQNISTSKKLSQGRIFMLQKNLQQLKQKLSYSQKARTALTLQVQTLTKRLKIRDSQIQKINQQDIQKYQCQELSATQEQILQDIKKLIKAVKHQQRNSVQFLLRKISLILSDLSKSRDIILECNDFLVQLMQILDDKLSKKVPQIVLDCNKFIRSFLMQNLSIF